MKTRDKSIQKKSMKDRRISSNRYRVLLITGLPILLLFSLMNLSFARDTINAYMDQLEESETGQMTDSPTSTLASQDLQTDSPAEPEVTLTETLTQTPEMTETTSQPTSSETQTTAANTPTSTLEISPTDTIEVLFTLTPTITITGEATLPELSAASLGQYYVSTSGSDGNSGTLSQPWKTIQHAVDSVSPGDTIFILEGTYNESVKVQKSGTSAKPIRLTNYNDQSVTINGGSNPALTPYKQRPQYWIVEGLKLKSTGTYTVYYDSWTSEGICEGIDHWTFRDNYISVAVQICGSYTLFEGNEVDGSKNNGNGGNGIHDTYSVSHDNTYKNNTIHDFSKRGYLEHEPHTR
jgi:hypothetical protein